MRELEMRFFLTNEMYGDFDFDGALERIWRIVTRTDGYLSDSRPWALAKDEAKRKRLHGILWRAAEALRFVTVLAHPVIPDATEKIWMLLGQKEKLAGCKN